MTDMESVMAGLEWLADTKNDAICEGIECSKIAKDAIALLKEQEQQIKFLKDMQKQMVISFSNDDIGRMVINAFSGG